MLRDFNGDAWSGLNLSLADNNIICEAIMVTCVDAHVRLVYHYKQSKYTILTFVDQLSTTQLCRTLPDNIVIAQRVASYVLTSFSVLSGFKDS